MSNRFLSKYYNYIISFLNAKPILIFLFLFNSLIFVNCNSINAEVTKDSLVFSKFPKEAKITFKSSLKLQNAFIRNMFFWKQNIVLTNLDERDSFVFSLYNPEFNKIEKKFLKRGTGINESIAPLSSGSIDNKFIWLQDISLSKILKFNLNEKYDDTLTSSSYKLPNLYYSTQLISEDRAYGFGGYHSLKKIQEINLESKNEADLFGRFDNIPTNFTEESWKRANEGFLFMKPNRKQLVFANRLMDNFYILDTLSKKSFSVVGPEKTNLNVEIARIRGNEVVITNEKTKRSYINGYCSNKFIYLLHTNNHEMHSNADQGNEIFVFDWSGKPIIRLYFSNQISSFIIDENKNIIYAFDPDSQEIIKAQLEI